MECLLLFQLYKKMYFRDFVIYKMINIFKKLKNVVKTTDIKKRIHYTNDTVKDMRSRKGE